MPIDESQGAPALEPTATTTDPVAEPELPIEQQALAAMDEAIAADADSAPPAAEPVAPATEPTTTTPAAPADAKLEPDPAIEKEITDRGLKGDSADRFRGMANDIRTFAPVKEALEKAGIKDATQVPVLLKEAGDYRDLIGMVKDTGASPQQYSMALDYLRVVNAAHSGDRAAAEQAYTVMQGELASLAQLLGKEVPGVHDPLAAHADLQQQVVEGDITRAAALEMASLRQAQRMTEGRQQQQQQQAATQQEHTKAIGELDALGAELAASDPHYAAKAPALIAALQELRESVHPSRWVAMARSLYARLPNPAAAAAAPITARPLPGAVRGSSVRPAMVAVTDDPFEAMDQGIAAANE